MLRAHHERKPNHPDSRTHRELLRTAFPRAGRHRCGGLRCLDSRLLRAASLGCVHGQRHRWAISLSRWAAFLLPRYHSLQSHAVVPIHRACRVVCPSSRFPHSRADSRQRCHPCSALPCRRRHRIGIWFTAHTPRRFGWVWRSLSRATRAARSLLVGSAERPTSAVAHSAPSQHSTLVTNRRGCPAFGAFRDSNTILRFHARPRSGGRHNLLVRKIPIQ